MIKRVSPFAILGLMLFAELASAELGFNIVSATATNQYLYFASPRASVMICNLGTNEVYIRLFDENETAAAATTSYPMIPAGSTTQPSCLSIDKTPTSPAYFKTLAIKCDTGETATVHIFSY